MVSKLTCKCELCGVETPHTGTKRCDACWELENRVVANLGLARKILQGVDDEYRRRTEFEVTLFFVVKRTPIEHVICDVVSGPHIDPPSISPDQYDTLTIMSTTLRLT